MNIQVRVLAANAIGQLKGISTQVGAVQNSLNGANGALAGFHQGLAQAPLAKFGNQLQWTGRQLQYNFTLPIALATGAAVKWQLANEAAFTKIAKVYGDFSLSAKTVTNELEALKGAFEALSNYFGVAQQEVLSVAADWAAAGASGIALAKNVEQTLRTMVLGELSATEATKALIAIQAQYGMSSADLADTIAKLNIIENQTGISMGGLIQGFERAAGVARTTGVDVSHLGALLAALTPAAGSAAQAGNALKTILSRLVVPTKDANKVMSLMGINTADMAWKSVDGAKKLEIMARSYQKLDQAQKAVVSSVVASRWQVNRFEVLMDQIAKKNGSYYATALEATADRTLYLAQAEKELNKVLDSNPHKLQQIWVILQNAMADVVQPLIPVILGAAGVIVQMVNAFRDLPPEVQKFIGVGLLLLALFGPLIRYVGSTLTLLSTFGQMLLFVGGAAWGAVKGVGSFLLLPFQAAGSALGFLAGQLLNTVNLLVRSMNFILVFNSGVANAFRVMAVQSVFAIGVLAAAWSSFLTASAAKFMTFAPVIMAWSKPWSLLVQFVSMAMLNMQRMMAVSTTAISMIWGAFLTNMRALAIALNLGPIWAGIMASLSAITIAVGGTITSTWAAVLTGFRAVTMAFGGLFLTLWVGIMGTLRGVILAGAPLWSAVWTSIQGITIAGASAVSGILAAWRTSLGGIMAATGTLMSGVWAASLMSLNAVTIAVSGTVTRTWAAFMFGMRTIMTTQGLTLSRLWTMILATMQGITLALGQGVVDIWFAFLLSFRRMTAAWGVGLQALWSAIWLAIQRNSAAYATALRAIWSSMMLGIQRVTAVFAPALIAMWSALMTGVSATVAAAGSSLAGVWATIGTAIQRVTVMLSLGLNAIWTAMMLSIQRITAVLGGVNLRAAWAAMMLGIQRMTATIGAAIQLVWSGFMASIAATTSFFSRAIPAMWAGMMVMLRNITLGMRAIVALFQASMMLMLTSPIRLAGIFRGGMALIRNIYLGTVTVMSLAGKAIQLAIANPWIAAVAGIVILLVAFRKELAQIWNDIVAWFASGAGGLVNAFNPVVDYFWQAVAMIQKAFYSLPESVQNAFMTVLQIIQKIALQIYEWMQYLNPFARHSPSVVDNVTAGVAEINRQFAGINVQTPTENAYAALQRFSAATKGLFAQAERLKIGEELTNIRKYAPQAEGAYWALRGNLVVLKKALEEVNQAIQAQQAVVDAWKTRLDAANKSLDAQNDKLSVLRDRASEVQDQLDAAKDAMSNWANTPIQGEGALEDAIFANEQAQKRLRLEMMKMEDVTGPIDDARSKLSKLQGEIETLQGEKSSLRAGGAGSDVTGIYDKQIAQLRAQQKSTQGNVDAYQQMQDELDKLQKKGERLDLEKSLKFDDLHRQMEKLANDMKEMPFDVIMAGMRASKADVQKYSQQLDAANKAVKDQEAVVKAATAARDAIQSRYDAENAKLSKLKDAYAAVNDAIQEVNSALQDMISAVNALDQAERARKKKKGEALGPGAQAFLDAKGGNFPVPGGSGQIGREGGPEDQSKLIDQYTQDLAKKTGDMFGGFDMFGPIKEKWNAFVGWWKKNIAPIGEPIKNAVMAAFDGLKTIDLGGIWDNLRNGPLSGFFDTISDMGQTAKDFGSNLGSLFGPEVKKTLESLVNGFKDIWDKIYPELKKFAPLIKPLGEAIKNVWAIAKPILLFMMAGFLLLAKTVWSAINGVLGPVLGMIGDVLKGVIKIIRGVIEVLIGIFTGDWAMMWKGVKDIVGGAFDAIWGIIKGVGKTLWGLVKGIVEGIYNFFVWLWDVLVGHSIVPDIVNGILDVFRWLLGLPKWIWDKILVPIFNFFKDLWSKKVKPELEKWWAGVTGAWKALGKLGKWVWDNVLVKAFNFYKGLWSDHVLPELKKWWTRVTGAWGALKQLGKWVWDNILVKSFNYYKDLWTRHVKPELGKWWTRVTGAWSALKNLGKWLYDNSLGKVVTKVGEMWTNVKKKLEDIRKGFGEKWNAIGGKAKSGINIAIDAINRLIDGLNAVAKILPGIDWKIGKIPKLATGGTVPAFAKGGVPPFVTNGPRAIVGEGRRAYPEYVIPTDPKYRANSMRLLSMANQDILNGTAKYARTGRQPARKNVATGTDFFAGGGVTRPVSGGRISQGYSVPHGGIDFAVPMGTNVRAAKSGVVNGTWNWNYSYGKHVKVAHGNGIETLYAHMSRIAVKKMQEVVSGSTLGRSGSTGNSTGPHLHFEVRKNGKRINPNPFLSGAVDTGGGVGDFLGDAFGAIRKNAVTVAFAPGLKAFDILNKQVPWKHPRQMNNAAKNDFYNWVKGENSKWNNGDYVPKIPDGGGTAAGAKRYAQSMLSHYGWGYLQWPALEKLWTGESGWRWNALNRSSGAYGIPQSLPGSKMASAGKDWKTNPATQIRWGMNYIKQRYGSPSNAYGTWLGRHPHWYESGGITGIPALRDGAVVRRSTGGTIVRVGEGNRDEAVIPLPSNFDPENMGKKEFHFHGDLSFPNIRSGDDAERFIQNLEVLARD
jgi:TP901 family phage tail tape measure protein